MDKLLLFLVFWGITGAQVQPIFSCWFPTFAPQQRVTNLVFSYNNAGQSDVIVPAATDGSNTLLPLAYNGVQSDILKTGQNLYQFTVTDTQNVLLSPSGFIVWQVGNASATVTQLSITPMSLCVTVANSSCPLGLPNFCENGVYCNGVETCSPVVVTAQMTDVLGVCASPAQGVQCPAGQICSEATLGCVSPPTVQPSPAPSASPTAESTLPPVVIIPSFYCWFVSNDSLAGQTLNLAFAYNNTGSIMVMRPVTTLASINSSSRNILVTSDSTPLEYNAQQSTLFMVGYEPLTFLLRDTNQVLNNGGAITWYLTTETLVLSLSQLMMENECSVVVPEDPASDLDATPAPTLAPQCTANNTNCSFCDTFCGGETECDVELGLCVQIDPSFSPCDSAQSQLPSALAVICVEHLGICTVSMNCTFDAQCNDGIMCTGYEYCVNGTCQAPTNFTCPAGQICVEGVGCQATGQKVSNQAVVAIVGGIFICLIILVAVIAAYFATNSAAAKKMRKKAVNKQ
jgi:hypothetical protein